MAYLSAPLVIATLICLNCFTPSSRATTLLDPRPEDSTTLFGRAIAVIGDVNSDGVPDLAVGAPFQDGDFGNVDVGFGPPQNVGKVYLVSGATLEILAICNDPDFQMVQVQKFGGHFGESVAAAGDINQDGVPDILIGAPHHVILAGTGRAEGENLFSAGRAFVCSGADGSVLLTLDDPAAVENGKMGAAVAGLGDTNSDGVHDLLVGVPGVGVAYLFSGADGSLVRTLTQPEGDEEEVSTAFGAAVANAGDLNHDGLSEALIGAPAEGQAFVFDGRTGRTYFTFKSPVAETEHSFGAAVAGNKDLDGDGYSDLAIGAPLQKNAQGRVYIFSGRNGRLRTRLQSSVRQELAKFGASILLSSDVSGDGKADVLVGSSDQRVNGLLHAGRVFIFDGASGTLLSTLKSAMPQAFAGFGFALAAADFTHAGVATPVIGTPFQNADLVDDDGDIVTHLQIGQIEIQ